MQAVEILEDPAVAVNRATAETDATEYEQLVYKNKDDCHLGCSNQVLGGVTIPAASPLSIQGVPTSPFKPKNVMIPSYQQIDLFIQQVTIGPFNAIEGDGVPAASHSEVSLTQFVSWPTIQANSPIRFNMYNADPVNAKVRLAIDVRGIRLRQ
jgi:hypothetical protein